MSRRRGSLLWGSSCENPIELGALLHAGFFFFFFLIFGWATHMWDLSSLSERK